MQRIRRIAAIAAVVAACAAVPATAQAHGAPTFERTFPVATRLCAKADAGTLPKRLAASASQVAAQCATLHAAYDAAAATFGTATAGLLDQAKAALAAARTTCEQSRANHDEATCRQARADARTSLEQLRATARGARDAYRTSVRAARHAFWDAIRALPGGRTQHADEGNGPAPAAPALPSARRR